MKKSAVKFLLRFFFICVFAHQQINAIAQDSSHVRISLLTCTPGDELYSIFGHSAIRVVDSSNISDIVYNYGTFNFDDEGFYIKFIRGQLLYYLSIEDFRDFIYSYQMSNRGITEQVLYLSAKEKLNILHALNENLKEGNKYYKYDFFLDNCTTRLRDLIVLNKKPTPVLPHVMPVNTRFRQAIHEYLDKGEKSWSKLGIDLLLGAPTDAVMTKDQQQFLPDNLMKALDSCSNVAIIQSSGDLYAINRENNKGSWFTPMVFFSLLLILFAVMGFSGNRRSQIILSHMDGLLFFFTGMLGVIFIFMMTATDHSMTKNNYNILWAWPTHLIVSFFINSKNKLVKKYFFVSSCSMVLVLLSWFFLPQQMNNALIPFVLLLLYRSAMKYVKHN